MLLPTHSDNGYAPYLSSITFHISINQISWVHTSQSISLVIEKNDLVLIKTNLGVP